MGLTWSPHPLDRVILRLRPLGHSLVVLWACEVGELQAIIILDCCLLGNWTGQLSASWHHYVKSVMHKSVLCRGHFLHWPFLVLPKCLSDYLHTWTLAELVISAPATGIVCLHFETVKGFTLCPIQRGAGKLILFSREHLSLTVKIPVM